MEDYNYAADGDIVDPFVPIETSGASLALLRKERVSFSNTLYFCD